MLVENKPILSLFSWTIIKVRRLHLVLKIFDPFDFALSTFSLKFIEYFLDPLVNINLMESDCGFFALSTLSKHFWH